MSNGNMLSRYPLDRLPVDGPISDLMREVQELFAKRRRLAQQSGMPGAISTELAAEVVTMGSLFILEFARTSLDASMREQLSKKVREVVAKARVSMEEDRDVDEIARRLLT